MFKIWQRISTQRFDRKYHVQGLTFETDQKMNAGTMTVFIVAFMLPMTLKLNLRNPSAVPVFVNDSLVV